MTLVWRGMEALATGIGRMVIYISSDLNDNDGQIVTKMNNNDY